MDFPELRFNEHECTEMPFRYVTDKDGKPIMPKVTSAQARNPTHPWLRTDDLQGMVELIGKDGDKTLDDMF